MDEALRLLDTPQLLALAAALGWVSGFRLYAAVFLVGLAGWMGWVQLPPGLQLLQHPGVLVASGFMLFAEFFADKIPWVDSVWDAIHTVIRIPAGAAGWGVFLLLGGVDGWTTSSQLLGAIGAGIVCAAAAVVYIGVLALLRAPELSAVMRPLRRFFPQG